LGTLNILNLWKIERHGELSRLKARASELANLLKKDFNNERPLHQDKKRLDLNSEDRKMYWDSNTALLIHGSRSVNIAGILRDGFRFPKELVGVALSGAAFGEGVYTADDYKKSVGYTSHQGSYWAGGSGGIRGRKAFMFACDVVLGNAHIPSGTGNFRGPPNGKHSIYAKAGSTSYIQNNEFIIFNKSQIAQKYLIEFTC
jgi:poly [ADP-ribose] polymerase